MNAIIARPAFEPRCSRVISATEVAPWRTEAAKEAKSCTAPMRTTPKPIHRRHGSHPNAWHARMGPAIGPAAAIAEKCWPKR